MTLLDLQENLAQPQDGESRWAQGQEFSGSERVDAAGGAPVFALNDSAVSNIAQMRNDAGSSIYPYGDLTHVLDKVLTQRHPPLGALRHFPVSREAGWADSLELYSQNDYGEAKIICCSNDFPRVQVDGCTWKTGFITLGTGYRICYDNLKAQEVSKRRINYEASLMRAAIRAIREKANKLAFSGSIARNILGICNNPFIPTLLSPYPLDNNQTAQDILAVLAEAACQQYVATGMSSMLPNAFIGPPSLMRGLMKRMMSSTGDSPASVMNQLALFAPNIEYYGEAVELENAGPNGERVAFFYRRDRESMEWHFPVSLEVLPPYWSGYEWQTNIIARTGSVWFNYPEDSLKLVGV